MSRLIAPILVVYLAVCSGWLRAADKPCNSFPSGIQQLVRGIDVSKLDMFPTDLAQTGGFQRSVVSLTCNEGKKWTHPYDKSIVFDIPDQVSAVNTIPGGVVNTKTAFIESTEDFKQTSAVDVGLDINTIQYGAYSLSSGYKKAQENLINSTKSMLEVSAYVSAIRVDLHPYYELKPDKDFSDFVDHILPATYAEDPLKYIEFVDTFGTHYFDSGIFGGFVQQSIELQSNLHLKMSEKDLKVNAEASFLSVVKLKGGYTKDVQNVSRQFAQSAEVMTAFYGGKANLMREGNNWPEWWDSVPRDPWLFGGSLKPITNLVSGPKKTQVTEAVRVKLDKALLEDLRGSLTLFHKYTAVPVTEELTALDAVIGRQSPVHTDVKNIKQAVADFLTRETAKLNKQYLKTLEDRIQSLQDIELFCKRIVADKCMSDHLRDVDETIAAAKALWNRADQLKAQEVPDKDQFIELSRSVESFIETQKHSHIGECKEKVFCNLCKITEALTIHKAKCDSTEVKEILDIHV
ncbi:perivitellin-2 67 kDa subunit-like [Oppia nitens]|uniref:perivitellin-2 67 kDa subunit-like n=1 Tax=Oppia nitens TaxID=1686743 RepID=UPI0023D98AC8|nr:perivitellin-2 67 kDa subunit-like [Oppia nitens]